MANPVVSPSLLSTHPSNPLEEALPMFNPQSQSAERTTFSSKSPTQVTNDKVIPDDDHFEEISPHWDKLRQIVRTQPSDKLAAFDSDTLKNKASSRGIRDEYESAPSLKSPTLKSWTSNENIQYQGTGVRFQRLVDVVVKKKGTLPASNMYGDSFDEQSYYSETQNVQIWRRDFLREVERIIHVGKCARRSLSPMESNQNDEVEGELPGKKSMDGGLKRNTIIKGRRARNGSSTMSTSSVASFGLKGSIIEISKDNYISETGFIENDDHLITSIRGPQTRAARLRSQLEPLILLSNLLARPRPLKKVSLPAHSIILSELSRPFLPSFDLFVNPSPDIRTLNSSSLLPKPDHETCKVALDLFEKICNEFETGDSNEQLERWIWCTSVMISTYEIGLEKIRDHLLQTFLRLINAGDEHTRTSWPDTPLSVQSFMAVIIRNLYQIDKLSESVTPTHLSDFSKIKNVLASAMDRLSNGKLVQLNLQSHSLLHWAESHNMSHEDVLQSSADSLCRISFLEGMIRAGSNGEWEIRKFIVQQLIEMYWIPRHQCPEATYSLILGLFSRTCFSLFHQDSLLRKKTISENPLIVYTESNQMRRIKRSILTIVMSNTSDREIVNLPFHIQENTTRLIFSLFVGLSQSQYSQRAWPIPLKSEISPEVLEAKGYLEVLWRVGIRDPIVQVSTDFITGPQRMPLDIVISILGVLCLGMSDTFSDEVTNRTLPILFDRIASEGPQEFARLVTFFLRSIAARHPKCFYRPLFACASSDNEEKVRVNLNILNTLSSLTNIKDIFLRDSEMLVVALMADVGTGKGNEDWSSVILGQQTLIVLITHALRSVRENEEKASVDRALIVRFVLDMEARLSVFLDAREEVSLLPLSQRTLLATLLLECRLLMRSNRRPPWLTRMVNWTLSSFLGAKAALRKGSVAAPHVEVEVTEDAMAEPDNSFHWLELLLRKAQRDAHHNHRASNIPPSNTPIRDAARTEFENVLNDIYKKLLSFVASLPKEPTAPVLSLLVSVYSFLTEKQLERLFPVIWAKFLDDTTPSIFSPASFLFMLCSDKIPTVVEQVVLQEMHDKSAEVRYRTVTRLVAVFASRFSILVQPIADPSKRRPFRIGRQQISFVPLDVGTPQFILSESMETGKLHLGRTLPPETRKALIALGWDSDDDMSQQITKTPMSLMCVLQFNDVLDGGQEPVSKSSADNPGMLRRKSSAGGPQGNGKRRATLVPSLALLLSKLVDLLLDDDQIVASAVREALVIFARDDPNVFLRPIFEELSGDIFRQTAALTLIRRLSNAQSKLPPAFVHQIFNYIGGLIRANVREGRPELATQILAKSLPVAARLLPELNGFNMLSFRKNKVEAFFLPSGAFWFSDPAPDTAMFPRQILPEPEFVSKLLPVPKLAFYIAMSRAAQNMILANNMRIAPQDAYLYKKLIGVLQLPQDSDLPVPLGNANFVPKMASLKANIATSRIHNEQQSLRGISLILARSWLVALLELLPALNRIFNSRGEMAMIMDTVNRILLTHGEDSNVVALAVRIFLLASTRFRRLFSSSNGFQLCFPSVFKVFCESENNQAIRVGIMYAFRRFYQHHEESFVFQAFGAITPLFASSIVDEDAKRKMAGNVFVLLKTLSHDHCISHTDILGLHNSNAKEEQQAMIHMINDKPEVFLAPLIGTKEEDNPVQKIEEMTKQKDFPIENSIRLFLTVIAFRPSSIRAGDFLFLFRLLLPEFYNFSGDTRRLLKEGMEALSIVFMKPSGGRGRSDVTDGSLLQPWESDIVTRDENSNAVDEALNWLTMQRLFLLVVARYYECGGTLNSQTMKRMLELLRIVLKDSTETLRKAAAAFMTGYTGSVFDGMSSPKQISNFLRDVAPVFASQANKVDFSSLLDALSIVIEHLKKEDLSLGDAIVKQFLNPALEACSAYASEGGLFLPIQASTIRLLSTCLTWLDNDVLQVLENQQQSCGFLARFVLPFALELRATVDASKDRDAVEERLKKAWTRLAAYVLTTWKTAQTVPSANTSASRLSSFTQLLVNQILKVIIIRGQRFISDSPSAWQSMASFLSEAFHSTVSETTGNIMKAKPTTLGYAFFSFAEFLHFHRSPLTVYLQPLIRKNLSNLRPSGQATQKIGYLRPSSIESLYSKPLLQRSMSKQSTSPFAQRSSLVARHRIVTGLQNHHWQQPHQRKASFDMFSQNFVNLHNTSEGECAQSQDEQPLTDHSTTSRIRHLGPQLFFHGNSLQSSGSQRSKDANSLRFGQNDDWGEVLDGSGELGDLLLQKIRRLQAICGESVLGEDPGCQTDYFEDWTANEAIARVMTETQQICAEFDDVLTRSHSSNGEAGTQVE